MEGNFALDTQYFRARYFATWRGVSEVEVLIYFVHWVRQNYGNQGLMERYKFNSLGAIN